MRIDSMSSVTTTKIAKKKMKQNSQVGFSEMMDSDIEASSNVEQSQIITETNPFLALQEVSNLKMKNFLKLAVIFSDNSIKLDYA